MKLHIADNLSLPLDAVTQTFGVLAKRGVGKTYTAAVFVEELLKAERQVVVVDPIGVWFGLRSSADGKRAGLPIIVMGGDHGDVPLEVTAGATIADFIVDQKASVVLDLSRFRKGEQTRFMTDFAETLYHKNRDPLMLVVDEADAFAPQRPQKGEERLLGAMEDLVRRGRARGLGVMLVTQRAAVLNKNVLTQVEVLIVLRTIAPQDREAIDAWVKVYGTAEQRDTLMGSLASLEIGDAWFWSPGWLGIFTRVHVRPRETFDSSATPKQGQTRKAPKELAPVDLEALKERIAAAIEKAKADDPKELRKQIAELKAAAQKQGKLARDQQSPATKEKRVEVPVLKDGQLARAERILEQIDKAAERLSEFEEDLRVTAKEIRDAIARTRPPHVAAAAPARIGNIQNVDKSNRAPKPASTSRPAPRASAPRDDSPLPPGEVATLTAALQYPGLDRKRLGVLTGYKRSSRDAYIARLSAKGLVDVNGAALFPTDAGRAALNGNFEPLPTGAALIEYWRDRLPEGERRTFDVLVQARGDIEREAIDDATGYKRSSRDAYLGRLKARGLVEFTGRGQVKASEELFD